MLRAMPLCLRNVLSGLSTTLVLLPLFLSLLLAIPCPAAAADVIVYTAHQDWLSRIYVLEMDGSVRDFFQYDFYRFVGMTVVDDEVYVAEAFAPRVYKVDIETGDLEVVVDDWSLYYFYDVAFDGEHLYVDEWDLNRYDLNGNFLGRASFDESVLGCTWDGQYFWTLDDANLVKCWDLSTWPDVARLPIHDFVPPSPDCRGLWFDGSHFWSAESRDGLGEIYVFDHGGLVIEQWTQPAFSGWGAVTVQDGTTGVTLAEVAPPATALHAVTPNPVHEASSIHFYLPDSSPVSLRLYNVKGESVGTLLAEPLAAGEHRLEWRPTALASGVYFLRLEAGASSSVRKVLVID